MRCDGEPVRPGIGTTRLMSRVFKPAKQIGTRSAYTIRASGLKTPRQQAGHKTVPDLAAISSKCPCKAGAIHTRASGLKTPRQQAGHKTVPDLAAISSKCPCKAGAIHTRRYHDVLKESEFSHERKFTFFPPASNLKIAANPRGLDEVWLLAVISLLLQFLNPGDGDMQIFIKTPLIAFVLAFAALVFAALSELLER